MIDHESAPKLTDPYRRSAIACMMESQDKDTESNKIETGFEGLNEANLTTTGDVQNYNPVLISLVRRAMPNLLAFDLGGVQTMSSPTQLIFAIKSRYKNSRGGVDLVGTSAEPATRADSEALFNEADPTFTGDEATGKGMTTAEAESMGGPASGDQVWGEMGMTLDSVSVTARSRGVKAEYTIEMAQDLQKVHGLAAETELASILSTEVIADINREYISTIRAKAQVGAPDTSTAGTFDLLADSDGRWAVERFKSLHVQLDLEANAVAKATRRGKGNWILCSSNVATALSSAGILDYSPEMATRLNVDDTGNTFAGVINGRMKVFIDPYATTDFAVVGYRGTNPYDAGIFYAPYVPLTMVRATDESTFQPKIGFKTRYGMVANPFALADAANTTAANALGVDGTNPYFREIQVSSINIGG